MAGTVKPGPGTIESHQGVQPLRDLVFEALRARVEENDYPIDDETDEEVAIDMCDCTDTFELLEPADLVPHVAEWRAANKK